MGKIALIGEKSMIASQSIGWLDTDFKDEVIKADLEGKVKVDITDLKSVNQFFDNFNFDWLILFAAFTDVNVAEKQRNDKTGLCWKINVEGTQNIVEACKRHKRKLLALSTDFVFDGTKGPYQETDLPAENVNKVSWYGLTKLKSERIIQSSLNNFIILRISYPYSGKFVGKDDLVTKILRLYKTGNLYPIYTDQIITPTFIPDIAPAISRLIKNNLEGIFHLASPDTVSQYQFAATAIELLNGDPSKVQQSLLATELANAAVPRPLVGGLKVGKIEGCGVHATDWLSGLKKAVEQFTN